MMNFNDDLVNDRLGELRKSEEEKVVQGLAPRFGLEYINLHGYTINPEAVGYIAEKTAREAMVIAFEIDHKSISIAMKNPNDARTVQVLNELSSSSRLEILPFLCSSDSLAHGWKRYADLTNTTAKSRGVFDIDENDIRRFAESIKRKEDVSTLMGQVASSNNARRVTDVLELMFAGAVALEASDIHIEPEDKAVRLRYRLDGMLSDIFDIDRHIYERLISRLKLLSGMSLNQKQEAQDGRFTFAALDREVEVRSSIIPGAAGESIVMRLLDPSVASFTLEKIDLNPTLRSVIMSLIKKPNGLIVTTGPTGSGKTTVLYAFLRAVHEEGVKIITIENPVEYKIEGIVQTQVGDNYTFASGLRAILRQDPDVIMVGEVRDHEVAETAIHAAETGHLVFSTLHTNSAVGGFPRLLDLGIDSRILCSAVSAFLGQRLVRRLCMACKKPCPATLEETAIVTGIVANHPDKIEIKTPLTLYKPTGCSLCGQTGFKGRMGIFEAILMDNAVEEVVIRDPREHLILAAARPQGIPTMAEDGIVKVIAGDTSLAELQRVVELPKTKTKDAPDGSNDETAFLSQVV